MRLHALPDDLRSVDDDPWLEGPLADAEVEPAVVSDAAIIDTISALQRHLNWTGARQARLLAEFTTRRPNPTARPPAPIVTATAGPGRQPQQTQPCNETALAIIRRTAPS